MMQPTLPLLLIKHRFPRQENTTEFWTRPTVYGFGRSPCVGSHGVVDGLDWFYRSRLSASGTGYSGFFEFGEIVARSD
jgi:hypothetical protein